MIKRKMKRTTIFVLIFLLLGSGGALAALEAKDYILGPGDVLEIHAWNETNADILIVSPIPPGITTAYRDPHILTVSRDGRVYIPMVGAMDVTGATVGKLEQILKRALAKFAQRPEVSVMVITPKVIRVNLAGEVVNPGLYTVPDGNPVERTILNYIKLAGGATSYAAVENISIVRSSSETVTVNLRKLVTNNDLSQNIVLNDGDTVLVPSASNQVYVVGQVVDPGAKRYITGSSVTDYIGMAGGLTKFAASDNIGIVRGDPHHPTVVKIKLNEYLNWDSGGQAILPGDIIFVPQSWYFDWADIGAVIVGIRDTRDAGRDLLDAKQWEAK